MLTDLAKNNRISGGTFAEEIEKGRLTYFPIQTQRPSLPIISSLAALFARWLFHPRTPIRSFVSLLGACHGNWVQPPLVVARFYLSTSLPHPTASGPQLGNTLMLPEMILRLRWGVCQ
jgi:hypothetical protein